MPLNEARLSITPHGHLKGELGNRPSKAEMVVWHSLAMGKTMKEIAWDRGSSYKTVEGQKARLITKIGARNIADLTRLAVAHGIIKVDIL